MFGSIWRILPAALPVLRFPCSHCAHRQLACTGHFRVNSNALRYDVWLIYRCEACGKRWKRSIERRVSFEQLGDRLAAYRSDDSQQVLEHAFSDVSAGVSTPYRVERIWLAPDASPSSISSKGIGTDPTAVQPTSTPSADAFMWTHIEQPYPCGVRWDRLLAAELGWSRARVQRLWSRGALKLDPQRRLRDSVRNRDRFCVTDTGSSLTQLPERREPD